MQKSSWVDFTREKYWIFIIDYVLSHFFQATEIICLYLVVKAYLSGRSVLRRWNYVRLSVRFNLDYNTPGNQTNVFKLWVKQKDITLVFAKVTATVS